jgi:hypothetical protein
VRDDTLSVNSVISVVKSPLSCIALPDGLTPVQFYPAFVVTTTRRSHAEAVDLAQARIFRE